jgi:hypothetical protein
MKLSKKAIQRLRENKKARGRIALAFDKTDFSVIRWIKENSANSMLTTAAAMQIIREETGLTDEQILEETETEVRA